MAQIRLLKVNADGFYEEHSQANDDVTFLSLSLGANELTSAKLGNLIDGNSANDEHIHDNRYFREDEHVSTSAGAGDAGKPVILDAGGKFDESLIDIAGLEALISHSNLQDLGNDDHTQYILVAGTRAFTGDQSMGGFKLTSLANPVAGTDAVNLQTMQAYLEGLKPKEAVRVATTVAGTLASDFEATDVIDGITLVAGDRILIKDQAAPAENGIYIVQASGAPVRADDFDSLTPIDEINGAYVAVQEGTANGGKFYVQSGSVVTIGTSAINFVFFNSVATLTGGDGITITGNDIDVDIATSAGLKFVSGQLAVEPADFAGDGLVDDGSDNLAIDWATTFTIDGADAKAIKASDLASTTTGKGASIIGVEDANGYFTGNNQEAVNNELYELAIAGGGVVYSSTAAVGDLVYVSANDTVSVYSNLANASKVVGVVVEIDGADRKVATDDKVIEGILSGATAGTAYYWDGSALTTTIPSAGGSHVWQVGIAKNATDLHLDVKFIKKNTTT